MVHERVRVGARAVSRTRELGRDDLEAAWKQLRNEVDRHHRRRALGQPSNWIEYLKTCRTPADLMRLAAKGGRQLAILMRGS